MRFEREPPSLQDALRFFTFAGMCDIAECAGRRAAGPAEVPHIHFGRVSRGAFLIWRPDADGMLEESCSGSAGVEL